MLPTVTQQLNSVRRSLLRIIPELPADADFAREQAQFVLHTVDWLLDVSDHQFAYEVIENLEYRKFIANAVGASDAAELGELRSAVAEALDEPAPQARFISIPMADLSAQNRRMKHLASALYEAHSALSGSGANPLRDSFAGLAVRQEERERAFFRSTGYVGDSDPLAVVLDRQAGRTTLD